MGPEMIGLFVPLGFFAMVVAIVIGRPMVKAIAAKAEADAKQPKIPGEVLNRLERYVLRWRPRERAAEARELQ